MNALKAKKDSEKGRLTRQIRQLKRINDDQRQEMLKMIEAHARVQQAAAEMNRLRLTTTRNLLTAEDIDLLSQQLSQIPGDFVDHASPVVSSPVSHRSKRSRLEYSMRKTPRTPLSALKNTDNATPQTISKQVKILGATKSCSPTQSQESPIKKGVVSETEYGDFIPDEGGFSQFEI
jgi:hypothetical protein